MFSEMLRETIKGVEIKAIFEQACKREESGGKAKNVWNNEEPHGWAFHNSNLYLPD